MVPKSVLRLRNLSAANKMVLAGMAMEAKGTGRIAISHGALAITCGCSRTTAMAACLALEKAGLIAKDGVPRGQVQPYRLLHPRLVSKFVGGARSQSKEGPKTTALLRCPRCQERCRALLKTGHCRGCRWNDKVDGRIEAKLKTRTA